MSYVWDWDCIITVKAYNWVSATCNIHTFKVAVSWVTLNYSSSTIQNDEHYN